jgi:bifunctional enzyme CysN/CysC
VASPVLRLLVAGSVDDGKSTLIGRLLCETGGVYGDQVDAIRAAAPDGRLDFAFITDGLRAERQQGITIDVAYRYYSTAARKYIVADAPGHEQYTRNMATGASKCDAALLLLDVRRGVLPQTRRHMYICWLMGIRRIVAAVNKMDTVEYSAERFGEAASRLKDYAGSLAGVDLTVLPVSALEGENVVRVAGRMPWYAGPTLLECLDAADPVDDEGMSAFRFPVQYIVRADEFRGFAGRVAAGRVRVGDAVQVLPSDLQTRVRRIASYGGDLSEAAAGQSITLQLEDELDIGRGDMICHPSARPTVSRRFRAHVVWMSETSLQLGRPYLLKQTTRQVCAEAVEVTGRVRLDTLALDPAGELGLNDIGVVDFEVHRPLVFDPYADCRSTGSFVLIDLMTNRTLGAGMILGPEPRDTTLPPPLPSCGRGLTIWLTGLPCSGKTTLAGAVYEKLRATGLRAELLDGDVIRRHLSKGLGFDHADRDENIRRIGFVADLLTRNGVIAVVAAISPYRSVREAVRRDIGRFVEVFVNAPPEVCEQRDTKGLYRLARSGGLPGFTGVDDPYEAPLAAEVECLTDRESVAESVEKILAAVRPLLHGSG